MFPVLPQFPEMAEADEFVTLFVPKPEGQRFKTAEEAYRLDLLEEWVRFVASLQVVIGNARAQMVNVVKADVTREPLKNFRQLVERTALKRRGGEVPIFAAFPINPFELMLDVEEPYAGGTGGPPGDQ